MQPTSTCAHGHPIAHNFVKKAEDQTDDTSTVVNILSLRWHPVKDTLHLAPKEMALPSSQPTSKRDVLQLASLGFISLVTVKAKLLVQELWKRKLNGTGQFPTCFHPTIPSRH